MQIGQAVYEALVLNETMLFHVVADWIEEYKQDHPEAQVYLKRLRTPGVRIRTAIDVVCKFGTRGERKLFCRIHRILMELRHSTNRVDYLDKSVGDLFSSEGRRKINRFIHVPAGSRSRKKPILSSTRKRTVLFNDFWYVRAFKILLAKQYPSPVKGTKTGGDQNPVP